MFMLELQWKEFKISMSKFEEWLRANAGSFYVGNQAHSKIELYFSEEPSQEIKDAIQAHYDSLVVSDYVSAEEIQNKIKLLKADMLSKNFDQLSVVQKKLLLGLEVTNSELGY